MGNRQHTIWNCIGSVSRNALVCNRRCDRRSRTAKGDGGTAQPRRQGSPSPSHRNINLRSLRDRRTSLDSLGSHSHRQGSHSWPFLRRVANSVSIGTVPTLGLPQLLRVCSKASLSLPSSHGYLLTRSIDIHKPGGGDIAVPVCHRRKSGLQFG